MAFIKNYWITMRPYLLFLSGSTGLLGLSFTELPLGYILLYGTVFFFSYGFGQALTDCFQTDTDALSSPYRPMVQGKVSKGAVFLVSLCMLLLSGFVLTLANSTNLLLAGAAVVGLITYTYFKRRWWGGPFYNAWIVALLTLMGYLSHGASLFRASKDPYLFYALLTVFFAYANFVLIGYFKDVEADRATGYKTLPVAFGRYVASWVSVLFGIFTLIPAYMLLFAKFEWQGATLMIGGILFLITALYQTFAIKKDEEAHRAISHVVHSYVLLISGMTCLFQPDWYGYMLLFYALFCLTLQRRPCYQQV